MANISNTYEGLMHSYSVWYPKSTWLFPNPNNFKLWTWIFSQYAYQSKMPVKYPNPCQLKISRTFLQNYLGQSKNTITNCITHMCDIHVLKRQGNSPKMVFDAAYVLGVLSMINTATDDDVVQIADLFTTGDINGLKKLGLKKIPNFDLPSTGSMYSDELSQILGQSDSNSQILGEDGELSQFLGNKDSSTSQILGNLGNTENSLGSKEAELSQFLGKLFCEFPKFGKGEWVISFDNWKVNKISIFNAEAPQNDQKDFPIFGKSVPKFGNSK